MSKSEAVKPPPIRVQTQGIEAKPVTMNVEAIDWKRLIGLPSFQMFAAERWPNDTGADSEGHAANVAGANGYEPALYETYCQWHKDKGYWPNETPMGELIAADGDTLIA